MSTSKKTILNQLQQISASQMKDIIITSKILKIDLAHLFTDFGLDTDEVDQEPVLHSFSEFASNIVEFCCELNVLW